MRCNVQVPTVEERRCERTSQEHGGEALTRQKDMLKAMSTSEALSPRSDELIRIRRLRSLLTRSI